MSACNSGRRIFGGGGPLSLSSSTYNPPASLPFLTYTYIHKATYTYIHTRTRIFYIRHDDTIHVVFPASVFSNWYNKTRRNAVTSFRNISSALNENLREEWKRRAIFSFHQYAHAHVKSVHFVQTQARSKQRERRGWKLTDRQRNGWRTTYHFHSS